MVDLSPKIPKQDPSVAQAQAQAQARADSERLSGIQGDLLRRTQRRSRYFGGTSAFVTGKSGPAFANPSSGYSASSGSQNPFLYYSQFYPGFYY